MSHYRAWQEKFGSQGRPTAAHLELTYRCNVTCKMCFQDRTAASDELTLEQWLRTVDQAREAGVLMVTLSGGEALLSPHFWAIAQHVRRRGMAFRVFTNGVLLTRKNCRRLKALQVAGVDISIFSPNPAVHDAVTGAPGSLRKALRGLAALRFLGVGTKIKCPLLDTSSQDFRAVRALAERFGSSVVFDPFISPASNGSQKPTQCRGDDQVLFEYFVDEMTRRGVLKPSLPRDANAPLCGVARKFTTVAPDGRVLPCPRMQLEAGNVKTQSLVEVWQHSPLLNKLRSTTFGQLETCGTCSRSGYCGRCSATALLEDGNMLGPSSRACHVAELQEKVWAGTPPPKPSRLHVLR